MNVEARDETFEKLLMNMLYSIKLRIEIEARYLITIKIYVCTCLGRISRDEGQRKIRAKSSVTSINLTEMHLNRNRVFHHTY